MIDNNKHHGKLCRCPYCRRYPNYLPYSSDTLHQFNLIHIFTLLFSKQVHK